LSEVFQIADQLLSIDGFLSAQALCPIDASSPADPWSATDFLSDLEMPLCGDKLINWDYPVEAASLEHVPQGSEILILKLEGFRANDECELAWIILRRVEDEAGAFERIGLLYTRDKMEDAELERAVNLRPEMDIRII
jgi:hypothetical protein